MGLLKLNFIEGLRNQLGHPIENILHKYGEDLCGYTKGVFSYIVTSGGDLESVTTFSLYILVPEIGYNYQILNLEIKDVETVRLHYYTLKTKQVDTIEIKVDAMRKDFNAVDPIVKRYLEATLANETYRYLFNQVLLKRESRSEKFEDR